MNEMKNTLVSGLPLLGLELSEDVSDKLCAFGAAMVKQNEVMNLTGITDDKGVANLHLLDSLTVMASADLNGKTLIDVGCGAGFPGVPLAVATRRESYDFATSRAVARLNILLELTAPYVKVGGCVLAMKGALAKEELSEAQSAIKKLGLKLECVKEFPIDGTNHAVIVLRKTSPTPRQYPRRFAKIKQAPL